MFRFGFFSPKRPSPQLKDLSSKAEPSHATDFENIVSQGVTLVTKEDIYYRKGDHMILLMRAGQRIQADLIPKLIKFGVVPEQFLFEDEAVLEVLNSPITRAMSLPEGVSTNFQSLLKGNREKIVIQDTDERSIKRLTDCLMACGIPMTNIQPVPILNNLIWAIEKYQPHMLFLDLTPYAYGLHERNNLGKTIEDLQQFPSLKQTILTLTIPSDKENMRQEMMDLAKFYNLKLIFKPVNRFILSDVLLIPLANS